ncbi:MAG: hypothetical protein C4536_07550 [Actinobacteria bacterium]|jgi:hypothetical protein|nr:MAG: hypothetical protein C4536_07550 [Actinomycetota bacterium]
MVALIIILVVLISIAADIVFFIWWFKRLRAEAIEDLHQAVGEERVYQVEDCNFFGRQSSGYKQWRGNGVLALTDRGIHFRMFIPRKELFVPLDSIRDISQPRSFLGKSKMKSLLRVDFTGEEGRDDACAWLVPSLQWWSEAVAALRAGKEPPDAPWEHHGSFKR